MPERRVTEVVTEGYCAGELVIEPQIFGDSVGDRLDVGDVFEAGTDMVVIDVVKDLRFVLQTPERRAVQYAGVVAREGRADFVGARIQLGGAGGQLRPHGVIFVGGDVFENIFVHIYIISPRGGDVKA